LDLRREAIVRRLIIIIGVLLMLVSAAAVSAQSGQTYHIVAPGETLSRIALRYNTTVAAIAAANGIYNTNYIYAGQWLLIPSSSYYPPYIPPPSYGSSYYTVRYGDTLASIAWRYNSTVWAISQANNLYNPNFIYAGQVLVIPPYRPTRIATYYVQPGDTLGRIAARYGTSIGAISSYNALWNPSLIYAGQLLYIPY
jgi:LysM repeat protein